MLSFRGAGARKFSTFGYKMLNQQVNLSHFEVREEKVAPALDYSSSNLCKDHSKPPMIVMHGLMGSKTNWRGICRREKVASRRDSYLVEMRNHPTSDHHDDFNYDVLSEDIIRFAD
mmetsp:Transcript_4757/g.8142  ORF Transcript_4757/g.8142 Transcript_4757/m.8142 type:complete len:116 (+) Transcript_4757:43-390(+)